MVREAEQLILLGPPRLTLWGVFFRLFSADRSPPLHDTCYLCLRPNNTCDLSHIIVQYVIIGVVLLNIGLNGKNVLRWGFNN